MYPNKMSIPFREMVVFSNSLQLIERSSKFYVNRLQIRPIKLANLTSFKQFKSYEIRGGNKNFLLDARKRLFLLDTCTCHLRPTKSTYSFKQGNSNNFNLILTRSEETKTFFSTLVRSSFGLSTLVGCSFGTTRVGAFGLLKVSPTGDSGT